MRTRSFAALRMTLMERYYNLKDERCQDLRQGDTTGPWSETLRYAQGDTTGPWSETLRCAQCATWGHLRLMRIGRPQGSPWGWAGANRSPSESHGIWRCGHSETNHS